MAMLLKDRADHYAKVALMVKDHMKVASIDPTVTGGLVGAGIGGVGNLLLRKFIERNKKVNRSSGINDFLLGAVGGGALGAGGTYLYNHGLSPDLSKTITNPSNGHTATLGQVQGASDNADKIEGSEFNRLKNYVLGGGSGVGEAGHTAANTALGATALSSVPDKRYNLYQAYKNTKPNGSQGLLDNINGKGKMNPDQMVSSGKFDLTQSSSHDPITSNYLARLGKANVPKVMLNGNSAYRALGNDRGAQRAAENAFAANPAGAKVMPTAVGLNQLAAKQHLVSSLAKAFALGQAPRFFNNLMETSRLKGLQSAQTQ